MEIVRKEGNRNVKRELEFYNLDAIIAVGYRVNSKKATKFRIWETKILKDYMIKGKEAYTFFKIVQNKLHYAITGKNGCRTNLRKSR